MPRIISLPGEEKPAIDKSAVFDFFEKRAEKVEALGPTRAVIYQDKSPDLADRRDAAEKALLYPKIELGTDDVVLDAGCGTGRWAELIIPACDFYNGIDVSPGLIQVLNNTSGTSEMQNFQCFIYPKFLPAFFGDARLFPVFSLSAFISI